MLALQFGAGTGMDVWVFKHEDCSEMPLTGWTWVDKGIQFTLLELVNLKVLYMHGKGRRLTP